MKIALIAVAVTGIVVAAGWLGLDLLSRDLCGNTVIAESVSPSGSRKAVLFERSCGATTGFSSQVSVLSADHEIGHSSGNVFVADGYPEGYTLHWIDDTTLRIAGVKGRVFKQEPRVEGVEVRYE